MTLTEAAEQRIQQGINQIFTVKEYQKFLTFASNFLTFSYRNVIMIYLQAPDAQYVAGMFAWKNITDEVISPDKVPILVLYPEYDDKTKTFEYTIRKVFDFRQVGNLSSDSGKLKELTRRCDTGDLSGLFQTFIKNETNMTIYQLDDQIKDMEVNAKTIVIPQKASSNEKFKMLLDYYLSRELTGDENKLIKGCIENTVKYLVYTYYSHEEAKRASFPYIQAIKDDKDKNGILGKSFDLAGKIVGSIDALYLDHLRAKDIDNER